MKLAIFGASGATGQHLVRQALDAGHQVSVLLRSASSLPIEHPRLTRIVGTLDAPAAVHAAIDNADAVISALGTRKGGVTTICSDGMRSILPAMEANGVRRLIALSAYGASETRRASWFIRFVRTVIREKMEDKDRMEELVRASASDWTLVRPPALSNGRASHHHHAGVNLRPGATARLPRADLAAFLLQAAEQRLFMHQAPAVSLVA